MQSLDRHTTGGKSMAANDIMSYSAKKSTSLHIGRPRNEHSHKAILNACLQLLVDVGYDNMSIERIAVLAKVGKATIYRHWTNKAEIVVEAVLHAATNCENYSASVSLSGNLRENMIEAVDKLCSTISNTDGAIVTGLIRAMQDDINLARLVRKNIIEVSMQPIALLIEHGIQSKVITDKIDFSFIYSIILSLILTRQMITKENLDREFSIYLVDYIVLPLIAYHTDKSEIVSTER